MATPSIATRTDKLRLLAGLIATESAKFSDAKIDQVLELLQRADNEEIQAAPEDVKDPLIARDVGTLFVEAGIAIPEGYRRVDAPESPIVKSEDEGEESVDSGKTASSLTSDTDESIGTPKRQRWCDVCEQFISYRAKFYHCESCPSKTSYDSFDLCRACFDGGEHCPAGHALEFVRQDKNGEVV